MAQRNPENVRSGHNSLGRARGVSTSLDRRPKDLNPDLLLTEVPANDDLPPDSSGSLGSVLGLRGCCTGQFSAESHFSPPPTISRPNLLSDDEEQPVASRLASRSGSRTEGRIGR